MRSVSKRLECRESDQKRSIALRERKTDLEFRIGLRERLTNLKERSDGAFQGLDEYDRRQIGFFGKYAIG